MAKDVPLGVRLNNPGNLEWGSPWEGLVPRANSRYYLTGSAQQKRFCEFKDAASGIRAIARTLITYVDKRKAADGSPIDTISEVINRWAPSFENNTRAYIQHVADEAGVGPNEEVDLKDYDVMKATIIGIIAHENAGYAYPDTVIKEGMRRAGVVKRVAAKRVPLTKETVAGGAAPAIGGLGVMGPAMPEMAQAVTDNQDALSSGDWIRIGIGALLIISAVVVIWSQYRKREAGAV